MSTDALLAAGAGVLTPVLGTLLAVLVSRWKRRMARNGGHLN